MMLIYRILFLPALCLVLPHYLYRMWRRGGYQKGFLNRFGIMGKVPPKPSGVKRIWIQAVSVGELSAIAPLLHLMQSRDDLEAIVTTSTSTGFTLLWKRLSGLTCWRGIFPIDFWPCSAAAWRTLKPDLAILMEGELWPEHIHQARLRKIPVILINARLSDRSYRRHFKFRRLTRRFLSGLHSIHASSASNARRFRALGWVSRESVHETGNLKLDLEIPPPTGPEERQNWLQELGFAEEKEPVILLGSSTWPGEEALLLDAFARLRKEFPLLRLLIVPRHAERKDEILPLLRESGLPWHIRSSNKPAKAGTLIHLADTTGELRELTAVADLVFIGKSMPPNKGGQTPIEAAALGRPIIMGPDMSNFRDISRRLHREGAALKIREAPELIPAIRSLLEDPDKRESLGKAAARLIAESTGASGRTFASIQQILDLGPPERG